MLYLSQQVANISNDKPTPLQETITTTPTHKGGFYNSQQMSHVIYCTL